MGKLLDEILKQDEKYQKRKKQYEETLEEAHSILFKLDEVVGDYSASYGDVAYSLGF